MRRRRYVHQVAPLLVFSDNLKVSQSKRLNWYEGDKEHILALFTIVVRSHNAMPAPGHSGLLKEPLTPDVRFMGEECMKFLKTSEGNRWGNLSSWICDNDDLTSAFLFPRQADTIVPRLLCRFNICGDLCKLFFIAAVGTLQLFLIKN